MFLLRKNFQNGSTRFFNPFCNSSFQTSRLTANCSLEWTRKWIISHILCLKRWKKNQRFCYFRSSRKTISSFSAKWRRKKSRFSIVSTVLNQFVLGTFQRWFVRVVFSEIENSSRFSFSSGRSSIIDFQVNRKFGQRSATTIPVDCQHDFSVSQNKKNLKSTFFPSVLSKNVQTAISFQFYRKKSYFISDRQKED